MHRLSGSPRNGGPKIPFFVPLFNPIARRLLVSGIPLGPNTLLTVRGRKSGQMRTTPVALVKVAGRRSVIGTFGDVNWVRNLRAAGEATLGKGGNAERVAAQEYTVPQRSAFFREVLIPYVRSIKIGRLLLRSLRAEDILTDPDGAAERRPVFELRPLGRDESWAGSG
jgi:deazaflavin-dependent oxidoreductase (nitroreductase family)